jgi:HEPN domain-containing protein
MNGPTQPDPERWAEAAQWLERADEDVRLAEKIVGDVDFLASAAFHCQQAAEYPRIHDIAQLGLAVAALRPELGKSVEELSGLTDWYVTPRYPGIEYRPSRQEVESALQKLKALRRQIEAIAPKPGDD